MKKIDKNGFALAEAIVVSVFVLGMFTYLAMNIIPLISKYDTVLNYDNPQEVYAANVLYDEVYYYLLTFNNYPSFDDAYNETRFDGFNISNNEETGIKTFDNNLGDFVPDNVSKYFSELINYLEIVDLYNLNDSSLCSNDNISRGMRDYCNYLYSKKGLSNKNSYSIYLIEFKNNKFSHFEVKAGDENA